MAVSKYNSEGYYDPTAYEALSNIEAKERKYRPIVYICSPYSGDVDINIENARRYCRFAVLENYIPIAPHLLFTQFLNDNDTKERELGLFFGNVLMGYCSEVWVFGEKVSKGMGAEIERAKRKNFKIRYFSDELDELKEVLN